MKITIADEVSVAVDQTEDAPEAEASDDAAEAPEDEKSEKPEGSK